MVINWVFSVWNERKVIENFTQNKVLSLETQRRSDNLHKKGERTQSGRIFLHVSVREVCWVAEWVVVFELKKDST